MKLYEIVGQLRELAELDDIPQEQLQDTLDMLNEDFDEKAERVAAFIRELESDEAGLKSEIDRLSERKRSVSGKIDSCKDYLRHNMQELGKLKIKGKLFSISLGKPSDVLAVSVEAESLPEKYKVIKISADTAAIKNDLKNGEVVSGCSLVEGKPRLLIK